MLGRHTREVSVAFAIGGLLLVLAFAAPTFFSEENLSDLFLANLPVLIVALGMTPVILVGEIDISVGSLFAICGVAAGLFAQQGLSVSFAVLLACLIGAALGTINGLLTGFSRIPSIVVTLAAMIGLRDALRWVTQGGWVQNLPPGFQWFGLSPASYAALAICFAGFLTAAMAWGLRNIAAGRAIYATGSNSDAARLAGIRVDLVKCSVFTLAGALTGCAAVLNAVRFNQIPSNAGLGLELKVIAAVVVGGAAITGGRGTIAGTLLGVILLGIIGPALTFLGVNAYWEKAIQGAIILTALGIDTLRHHAARPNPSRIARHGLP